MEAFGGAGAGLGGFDLAVFWVSVRVQRSQ